MDKALGSTSFFSYRQEYRQHSATEPCSKLMLIFDRLKPSPADADSSESGRCIFLLRRLGRVLPVIRRSRDAERKPKHDPQTAVQKVAAGWTVSCKRSQHLYQAQLTGSIPLA